MEGNRVAETCYGCRYLVSRWDGAGGVTYYCGRVSGGQPWGVVVGEVDVLTDDEPHPLHNDCYEAENARGMPKGDQA
jgi:hypothetical protein